MFAGMFSRLLHHACRSVIVLTLATAALAQPVSPAPYAPDQTWHADSKAKFALRFFINASTSGMWKPVDWRILDFPAKVEGYFYPSPLPDDSTIQKLSVEGFVGDSVGWSMDPVLDYKIGVHLDLDGEAGYEKYDPYWIVEDEEMGMVDGVGFFTVPALPARAEPYVIKARWRSPTGEYIVAACSIYVGYSTGISVADGETFTNSLLTKLGIVAPSGSVWARLSNDGGFAGARTFEVSQPVFDQDWQMADDYVDKSTRVVYVKFFDRDGGELGTFSDSIIYDPEPPEIVEATLTDDSSSRARKAAPSRNLTLRVKAQDTVSGVDRIEIRRWNKPDKTQQRKLTSRISLPRNEGGVSFRVSDRAGNWTAWRDLKRPGADAQRPTLTVTAPKGLKVTTTASRYVLKGNAKDNIAPRSVRFRIKGPKDKRFGEPQWLVLKVGNKEKAKGWRRSIKLGTKGQWKIEVLAYDAEGNATRAQTVTVTRR